MKKTTLTTILSFTSLMPSLALAHEGAHHHATWFTGLLHPITGADHLLAMLLMGVLAALLQTRQATKLLLAIAACFVGGLALGTQMNSASILEPVLYSSVVALPLFAFGLMKRGSLHLLTLMAVAAFGASHGVVLGAEAVGSVTLFTIGATFSSLSLCALGFGVGRLFQAHQQKLSSQAN